MVLPTGIEHPRWEKFLAEIVVAGFMSWLSPYVLSLFSRLLGFGLDYK